MSASPQVLRNDQEEIIWQEIARVRGCQKEKGTDLRRTGSATTETRCSFEMISKNGDTIETLRELIGVDDREGEELATGAAFAPPVVAVGIESMLHFREKVLEEFNRLVENARGGDSSRPLSA